MYRTTQNTVVHSYWEISRRQPRRLWENKGFEICKKKTEIMFKDEDEPVGILSEYA
jgi:hypothetical protein